MRLDEGDVADRGANSVARAATWTTCGTRLIPADRITIVKQSDPGQPPDGVRGDGVFSVVVEGYDAVYPAVAASLTFRKLWAEHACGGNP